MILKELSSMKLRGIMDTKYSVRWMAASRGRFFCESLDLLTVCYLSSMILRCKPLQGLTLTALLSDCKVVWCTSLGKVAR